APQHPHPPSFPTRRSSDLNIDGKKNTGGTWGSIENIDTTTAGVLTKGPSANVDGSANINLVYVDSSGAVKYRQRTSSWQSATTRSEEHTSELQSRFDLVCR